MTEGKQDYKNLQDECDYYRRAFRDLNKAVAAFLSVPDPRSFEALDAAQKEINSRE